MFTVVKRTTSEFHEELREYATRTTWFIYDVVRDGRRIISFGTAGRAHTVANYLNKMVDSGMGF